MDDIDQDEPNKDLVMYSMTDLSAYTMPAELFVGNLRKFAPAEFIRQAHIGDGPNSVVYKAKDRKEEEKIVALKVIEDKRLLSDIPKEIFREITILKNLDHDNVIKLIEVALGSNPESLCLVFEYCPITLDKYIQTFPNIQMRYDSIKCIAVHLFRGLNYLHKNYIVHRDIKPSNLLISREGILKIIDFGISRRFSKQNKATTPGQATRWYQAPEIVFGLPEYDHKVDMWSAGCVLAEVLGKQPFLPGESEIAQINLMIDLLGTPTPKSWPEMDRCRVYKMLNFSKQPFNKLADRLESLNCGVALPILSTLFVFNPCQRAAADECLIQDWLNVAPYPSKTIDLHPLLSNLH